MIWSTSCLRRSCSTGNSILRWGLSLFFLSLISHQAAAWEQQKQNVLIISSAGDRDSTEASEVLSSRVSINLYTEDYNAIIIDNDSSVSEAMSSASSLGASYIIDIVPRDNAERNYSLRAYSAGGGDFIAEEKVLFTDYDDPAFLAAGLTLVLILNEPMKPQEEGQAASGLPSLPVGNKAAGSGTGIDGSAPPVYRAAIGQSEEAPSKGVSGAEEKGGQKIRKHDFLIGLDAGGFVSTFKTADYFSSACSLTARGLFRFIRPRLILECGGSLNYIAFTAEGVNQKAVSSLSSFKGVVGIESIPRDRFYCFYRIAAGGSSLLMNTEEEGTLQKIIPSMSCEVGSGLLLNENWNLSVAVNYSFFYEESLCINGFTPCLGVNYLW